MNKSIFLILGILGILLGILCPIMGYVAYSEFITSYGDVGSNAGPAFGSTTGLATILLIGLGIASLSCYSDK